MRRRGALLATLALASLAAGCGADEEGGSTTKTVVRTTTVDAQEQLTSTSTATSTVAAAPGIDGTTPGQPTAAGLLRPFAPNSPWNTPIENAEVDPDSAEMLKEARRRIGAVDTETGTRRRGRLLNDPLFINRTEWTVPVVDETNGVDTPVYCRQPPLPPLPQSEQTVPDERALCGDGWAVDSLLIPANEDPHPEYDGWFSVINRSEAAVYDLWRARRSQDGSSLSYQFMRRWDLNGPGFLAPNRVSARGSGLPFIGGLIFPEEIEAGRVDHALAISVPAPSQGNYVQPASSTDGIGSVTSLPEGARIRLRRDVTLRSIQRRFTDLRCNNPLFGLRDGRRRELCTRYRFQGSNQRAATALIEALHRYGAIVVDRARVPTLYAQMNADWSRPLRDSSGNLLNPRGRRFARGERRFSTPLLRGNELQGIRLVDFEVVDLPERIPWPELGTIEVSPLPGGAVGETPTAPAAPRRTRTAPQGAETFQPSEEGG